MKKIQLSKGSKISLLIIGAVIAIPIIFLAWFVIAFFMAKANQITQAEADTVCQQFFEQVKSDVSSIPGYTILNEDKRCSPSQDEAGLTDYYFDATFKVAKAGSSSAEQLKADIKDLADTLSDKGYPSWIRNNPTKDSQPATICVNAKKQIQESGEVYQSSPPVSYPDYIEQSEFTGGFVGSCDNL